MIIGDVELASQQIDPYVELTRETSKTRLTIDGGKDVQSELLGSLDNDMVASGIPSYHVVVFLLFEKTEIGWHKVKDDIRAVAMGHLRI